MNFDLLDNPIWHSLSSHHRHLAVWGDIAARYPSDIASGAGTPENSIADMNDLKRLVEVDEIIAIIGTPQSDQLPGWEILNINHIPQMVCENLKSTPEIAAINLATADVPDMLNLIALTEPGPFLPRTIELGRYLGLHHEGQLVAMAGQRMHLTGFCEISAVCTHPDYRGRGYAGALTSILAQAIFDNHETPFLHLAPNNHEAMRLYKKLGFQKRKDIPMTVLKRVE